MHQTSAMILMFLSLPLTIEHGDQGRGKAAPLPQHCRSPLPTPPPTGFLVSGNPCIVLLPLENSTGFRKWPGPQPASWKEAELPVFCLPAALLGPQDGPGSGDRSLADDTTIVHSSFVATAAFRGDMDTRPSWEMPPRPHPLCSILITERLESVLVSPPVLLLHTRMTQCPVWLLRGSYQALHRRARLLPGTQPILAPEGSLQGPSPVYPWNT